MAKFLILSPDGFSIKMEGFFKSEASAEKYFVQWVKGYEKQGYYNTFICNQRVKIPLDKLRDYCKLVRI